MADPLWFFTPIQIATTVIAGGNFGASALQSPLTWPMLQNPEIPVHYVGKQTAQVLHGSEFIFPPANAFCTLANLTLSALAYKHSDDSHVASTKYPLLAAAAGLHIATTVYTLAVMAPRNRRLVALSKQLSHSVDKSGEGAAGQDEIVRAFRETQQTWKVLNYGRGAIMLAATVTSAIALAV